MKGPSEELVRAAVEQGVSIAEARRRAAAGRRKPAGNSPAFALLVIAAAVFVAALASFVPAPHERAADLAELREAAERKAWRDQKLHEAEQVELRRAQVQLVRDAYHRELAIQIEAAIIAHEAIHGVRK